MRRISNPRLLNDLVLKFKSLRGLNDPQKQREKLDLKNYSGSITCLLETHILKGKYLDIFSKLFS